MRLLLLPTLALIPFASAQGPRPRSTDWLVQCGHGAFTHYLADNRAANISSPDAWNTLVDGFNVTALAQQLASAGVCYHFITLGQNSGYYLAPNPTYDDLTGISPSKLSRRNLVNDLAAAYAPYGIKLGVYVPSGAPCNDAQAVAALNWTRSFPESIGGFNVSSGSFGTSGLDAWGSPWGATSESDSARMVDFQFKWNAILADWSRSFGANVHAWWVDGMYWPMQTYDWPEEPNFASLANALRAGNPDAIVAFNPGQISFLPIESCEQDFTAGEIANYFPSPAPRRTGQCGVQYHILSYLGQNWGERGSLPRFNTSDVWDRTEAFVANQWAITWDAPIDDSGLVEGPFVEIFAALSNITGDARKGGRRVPRTVSGRR